MYVDNYEKLIKVFSGHFIVDANTKQAGGLNSTPCLYSGNSSEVTTKEQILQPKSDVVFIWIWSLIYLYKIFTKI
jgi:hypothetical protein